MSDDLKDSGQSASLPTSSALIGFECSGVVRDHLQSIGVQAWSCDIKPCERETRGKYGWHYQCCITEVLESDQQFDFIGLHPDCTKLAVSGNRWYGRGTPGQKLREQEIEWVKRLWDTVRKRCRYAYLENPVGVIWKHLDSPMQYIQPWEHGHGETKKTGLALHNLPPLKPSNIVEGREQRVWRMPPGENRKADRSRTYEGVGKAIADQWGRLLLQNAKEK